MKYLYKIKLRGRWLWCHATDWSDAFRQFTEQTGEPVEEYGIECVVKNLDGSALDEETYKEVWGLEIGT